MAKKLTGKTINWIVIDRFNYPSPSHEQGNLTRKAARLLKNFLNVAEKSYGPHRIARIEVSK